MSYKNYFAVQHLLYRFMRSFDEKNWLAMDDCLAKTVYCDYSSFRDEKPKRISRTSYVRQRMERLETLKTQHNLSNLDIGFAGNAARIICNYAIYRFHPKFNGSNKDYFHSYGQYEFECEYQNDEWLINSITQKLLTNDGNPKIYNIKLAKKK